MLADYDEEREATAYLREDARDQDSIVDCDRASRWEARKGPLPSEAASYACAPDCEERTTCADEGDLGHGQCGWCDRHGSPRHHCGCYAPNI